MPIGGILGPRGSPAWSSSANLIRSFIGGGDTTTTSLPNPLAKSAEQPTVEFVEVVWKTSQHTGGTDGSELPPRKDGHCFCDTRPNQVGRRRIQPQGLLLPRRRKKAISTWAFDGACLKQSFSAPAVNSRKAYVLAHEVGHHIQKRRHRSEGPPGPQRGQP